MTIVDHDGTADDTPSRTTARPTTVRPTDEEDVEYNEVDVDSRTDTKKIAHPDNYTGKFQNKLDVSCTHLFKKVTY